MHTRVVLFDIFSLSYTELLNADRPRKRAYDDALRGDAKKGRYDQEDTGKQATELNVQPHEYLNLILP